MANITGTNGNDNLLGTPENDTLDGLIGADTLTGGAHWSQVKLVR